MASLPTYGGPVSDRLDFKQATRAQLECIWKAVAAETGDDRFFTAKELDALPRELAPYEQVLSFSSGSLNGNTWLIVLTDERVLFLDKGMLFGMKKVSVDLNRIANIESERGLMFGKITIGANGQDYSIEYVWKSTVDPFVEATRHAMRAWAQGQTLISPGTEQALSLERAIDESQLEDQPAEQPQPRTEFTQPIVQISQPMPNADQMHWNARLDRLFTAGLISAARRDHDRR